MKKYFILLAMVFIAASCAYLYNRHLYKKTDGFTLQFIQFEIPHNKKWEIEPLSAKAQNELNDILSQRYAYLSKGARSYAFVSADGQYVLKFFKFRYNKPHWAAKYLPSIPPFEGWRARKMQKVSLDTVLTGYKIAYDYDPQGTALLYIHLNPGVEKLPSVLVTDKEGALHRIDLSRTRFVLQKKAMEYEKLFDSYLKQGQIEAAKESLRQVFDLYERQYQAGVCDTGVGILRNNGFIDGKPVHFDVGKMTDDPDAMRPERHRQRMRVMAEKVNSWVKKRYPQYQDAISQQLQKED